jgi:hypothetical protein
MDYIFERAWQETLDRVSKQFGEKLEYGALLMLIGLQELGQDYAKYKKDEKIDLMHIGVCTVLLPFGYYKFMGRDEQGWPHFERVQNLPPLEPSEQELLIRKAIVEYFKEEV